MYQCDICDYETNDKPNYNKHNKSKRHHEKVNEVVQIKIKPSQKLGGVKKSSPKPSQKCDLCYKFFTRKDNLTRHLLKIHEIDNRKNTIKNTIKNTKNAQKKYICIKTLTPKNANIPPKNAKNNKMKSIICEYCCKDFARRDNLTKHYSRCKVKKEKLFELDKIKKENIEMRDEIEDLKIISKNAVKANKYAMSAFKTLTEKFVNSPTLEIINGNGIETIVYKDVEEDDDNDLVNALIYYHGNNTLVKYLGDSLVTLYKKNNPHIQSFWNSDTQRLSYIIRTLVVENPEWVRDTGGKKIITMIIAPLIEHIDKKLKEYILGTVHTEFDNIIALNERLTSVHKIREEIRDRKVMEKNILGYISPFFHFNANNLIILD